MVMDIDDAKRIAGVEAAKFVFSGMKVGLGTGSTVKHTCLLYTSPSPRD